MEEHRSELHVLIIDGAILSVLIIDGAGRRLLSVYVASRWWRPSIGQRAEMRRQDILQKVGGSGKAAYGVC